MSVQERNSEMVEILSPDFVRRKDSTYQAGALAGAIMALPGIVSYWPMGVALEERTTLFADEVMIGSDLAPAYDLQIVNGGTNAATIDGAFRAGQGGAWAAIDGPTGTGWAGFGTNFYYNGNTPTYRETNEAAQIFMTNQFQFRTGNGGAGGTPITWIDIATMNNLGWLSLGSNLSPSATLQVARGTSGNGSAMIWGSTFASHFNYGNGVEDTYLRGGIATSLVHIGDTGAGVAIAGGGGYTTFGGRIGSVWTGFSFGSGWTNYGGFSLGSFKKVGDVVFLRGLVQRVSGVGTIISNLPAGFRPLATELFDVITDAGQGRVDIDSSGNMTLISGGTAWVAFSGLNFSII